VVWGGEVKDGMRKKEIAGNFFSCLKNGKQTGSSAVIKADLRLRLESLYQTRADKGSRTSRVHWKQMKASFIRMCLTNLDQLNHWRNTTRKGISGYSPLKRRKADLRTNVLFGKVSLLCQIICTLSTPPRCGSADRELDLWVPAKGFARSCSRRQADVNQMMRSAACSPIYTKLSVSRLMMGRVPMNLCFTERPQDLLNTCSNQSDFLRNSNAIQFSPHLISVSHRWSGWVLGLFLFWC